MEKPAPFFKRFKGLHPAALWLGADGRHYSGSPIDGGGPDMDRLREYFQPGRKLYVCAWGAWGHGRPCVVANVPDPVIYTPAVRHPESGHIIKNPSFRYSGTGGRRTK